MRTNPILRLLLALCLAVATLAPIPAQAAMKMPAFALPSVKDGSIVKSDAYQGQVLLINFFATWCPPCRKEIPALIKLQKEFGPKGFTVIALSTDQAGAAEVDKFARKMEINYPVLMSDTATPKAFGGILGIPTSFLVNRQGEVVKRYDGYSDERTLIKDISSILK